MTNRICVLGLGYVGLPLAIEFDRAGIDVIGYDIDQDRIETLNDGVDPTKDLGDGAIQESSVNFTSNPESMQKCTYILVTVPTPVDELKNPNLTYVEEAGEVIGKYISKGTTVILESTVYPGATREILAPAIERNSELELGEGFFIGYSPERLVPGDDEHSLKNVVKIVSGQDGDVLDNISQLYKQVVDEGVHRAPEIEVAEAAKCIENIQRDVNIALVNELAVACANLNLDTHEVLEAANTKWNFHNYQPGLVGGHCIPVDPFHIIFESERNGFSPKLIEQSREVNEYMPEFIAELVLHGLNDCGKVLRDSTVLVLGLAYKPGVGDIRTSAVNGTIQELQSFDVNVIGYDPHAPADASREEFHIGIQTNPSFEGVDAILLSTPHEEILEIDFKTAVNLMEDSPLLVDVSGSLDRNKIESSELEYVRV